MTILVTPTQERPRKLDDETKRRFDDRRSTFHRFHQYLFPSEMNESTLPGHLEAPYAYSHHQAAFYWTRQDALSALIWNPSARPPCLNCVLAGEAVAKRCDRMERQWSSEGLTWCCKTCVDTGHEHACVEMIELRIVPKFCSLFDDGSVFSPRFGRKGTDRFIWTADEKALRRQGKVIWRPINLHSDDFHKKAELMARFEAGGAGEMTRFCISPGLSHPEKHNANSESWLKARFMMRRKVEHWDRAETSYLVLENDPGPEAILEPEAASAPRVTPKLTTVFNDSHENKENSEPVTAAIKIDDVERDWLIWRKELLRARHKAREEQTKDLGQGGAAKIDAEWHKRSEQVLEAVRHFLDKRSVFLARWPGEVEKAVWEAAGEVDSKARVWIEELVPELLFSTPTYHRSSSHL
jgi:hypothetical protein